MKHSLLFLAFLPLLGFTQDFECTSKVDSKKAVVFINLNGSFLEARAAEEAACARGEAFIHIPKLNTEVKAFAEVYIRKELLADQLKKRCRSEDRDQVTCSKLNTDFGKLDEEVSTLLTNPKIEKVDYLTVGEELKNLAKKNIATTSIILSGHDGGGAVSGVLGRLDKEEFIEAFKGAYAKKPKLSKKLQSTLLWGCYTSTPVEVIHWKKELPQLKIIAGFAGSGPSHLRDAGHRLMNDILVKEKSIIGEETMDAAKLAIQGLSGAAETYIGLYAQCSEKKDEYYSINDGKNSKFEKFAESRICAEKEAEIEALNLEYDKYMDGDEEIPLVTDSGPLRAVYTQSRALAHCLDPAYDVNANQVGLLLFSRGMQKNFAQTFAEELKGFHDECSKLDTLVSDKSFPGWNQKDAKVNFKAVCGHLKESTTPENFYLPRPVIAEIDHRLEGLGFYVGEDFGDPKAKEKSATFPFANKLRMLVNKYLFYVNSHCMDFDLWHDYKPGVIAKGNCQ